MLFAWKMVAPIRLCRAKQGHLGWRCWQGGPPGLLPGPAWGHAARWLLPRLGGASRCSPVPGSCRDPCPQGWVLPWWVQDEPGCGSSSWEVPRGWGDIACGCGSRAGGCVPPQPSPFPRSVLLCALCSAQGSAQAVPGALPMPQAKPSAFTFSCPGYFKFQTLPSRERCFPQLFPFLILQLLLKPLSSPSPSIPDTVQMEKPQLAASETDNSSTAGLPFLPERGKSITGFRLLEDQGRS